MPRVNQKQRSEKVKEDIIDVALELAPSEGFEALSMRKISKKRVYDRSYILLFQG
jgi:AcrR family transcriptional regulator